MDWLSMDWVLQNPYTTVIIIGIVLAILTRSPGTCAVLAVAIMIGIHYIMAPALTLVPSSNSARAVDNPPEQTMLPTPVVFQYHGQHTIKALAKYVITARVLSVKEYPGEAVPIDVALGWGPMADPNVIAQVKISQSQHFYEFRYDNQPPIPVQLMSLNSANNHILPATIKVESQINNLRKGQLVSLGGYLVNIEDPGGLSWKTSLTRDDTGAGACELFYVQSVTIF